MSASASVEKAVSSSVLWACEELQLPAALAEDTQVALRLKLAGSIKKYILNNTEDRLEEMSATNPVHSIGPKRRLLFKMSFEWCILFWKCPVQSFAACLT